MQLHTGILNYDGEVERKLAECMAVVKRHGLVIARPEIVYNLKGRYAGWALDGQIIRLNASLLKGEHRRDMIESTLPHEFAHIVVQQIWGRSAKPHGQHWKGIMEMLGVEASRCHSYNTQPARVHPRIAYHCECREWGITKRMHNQIQRGIYRRCPDCKSLLEIGCL